MSEAATVVTLERTIFDRLLAYAPMLGMLGLAIALRLIFTLCTDVSWLLTLGEQVLHGRQPYVDFIEVNPPASIYLYLPAIYVARALHVAPELAVVVMVFVLAAVSTASSLWLLRRSNIVPPDEVPLLSALAALVLLVLPLYVFAQREHIALLLLLPMLSVYTTRAHEHEPPPFAAFLAGLAGGMTVVIKPYFAFALALPFLSLLWRNRRNSERMLRISIATENLAAVGVAASYLVLVFWKFPAFIHVVLPMLQTVYIPVVRPLWMQLLNPTYRFYALAAIIAVLLGRRRLREPIYEIPMLASVGFLIAVFLQGKGWPYHGYPAISLLLLVLGTLLVRRVNGSSHLSTIAARTLCGYVLACAAVWFQFNTEQPDVEKAVEAYGFAHPKILTISADISLGHPLTRHVHGSWAGAYCSLWIADNALYLLRHHPDPSQVGAIRRYAQLSRQVLVHDLRDNKPDVVLIDGRGWRKWAMSYPAIRTALEEFREDKKVGDVEIWLKKSIRVRAAP
ncbi:MAG TPA: hypothetical protein VHC42_12155 [Rhizomicrobium sp.]|nr:hypothetical protein [Rhizomicrobium sp.]